MTYKTRSSSLKKLSVRQLRARRRGLARRLPDVEASVQGSLQAQMRRCGKEGCRCTKGELHGPYTYLAMRAGPRGGLLYVPAELAEELERKMELTRKMEAVLAEISAINLELLARGKLD